MTADFRDREGCLNRSNPLKRAGQRGAFISSDEEAVGSNPVTSTDWTSRAAACAVGLCAQISHTAVKYSNVEHPEADLKRLRLGPPRLVAGLVDDVAVG